MTIVQRLLLAMSILVFSTGCDSVTSLISPSAEGSQQDAQAYLEKEFAKWVAGQDSEASTLLYNKTLKAPIAMDIRSVTPDKPDILGIGDGEKLPPDWRTWPAFRFNVAVEWKSKAGSPMTEITTYTLSWHPKKQRWFITERI